MRQLFSAVFGYDEKELPLDYGLDRGNPDIEQPRLMFLHGTTWPSKEWPEERWCELAAKAIDKGYFILVPHGNEEERLRAQKIVDSCSDRHAAVVLSPGSIARLMTEMQHCTGIVSVDTGPGHLATAINIPMIGIYGSTDPILTSPHGELQDSIVSDHLQCIPCLRRNCKFQRTKDCAKIHPPCYENITADMVLNRLTILINSQEKHDSA